LGCTLAEFTLALTGCPVTWFLWHFMATQNPVGFFRRRQVALPRLTPGAVLHRRRCNAPPGVRVSTFLYRPALNGPAAAVRRTPVTLHYYTLFLVALATVLPARSDGQEKSIAGINID